MATTVGSHSISTFATPVNGGPLDANVVRGNDNTIKTAYVAHDADTGIHVQSSTLAARPAAGTAGRKWITEDSGVYTLWFDDGTNWHPVSSENVALTVLATENLAKGDVVKVVGWNNGQDLPEVAKVASASDVAFAIITAAVTNGAMGYATNTGIVQDLNTNAFSAGTILYPNTSGGFTSTKPTSGNYQTVAFVLRQNANNGVIFVEFSSPRIVERSDNTASTIVLRDASGNFSAGTVTAGALTASGAVSAGSVTSTGLVTFASLKGTGATTVTNIINDGTMATASSTTLATSSSIKTYVDSQVATVDTLAEVLANGNTTGANDIIVNAGQKIRTPLVAAQDGTSAITIANTTGALTLNTALADSNLATISTAGKVSNSATTATSANTASAIVARDSSGNFAAGTITAALTGNASTATTLQTARNINGVSFNGSADITVTAAAGTLTGNTLASGVTASSLTSVGTLTSLTTSGIGNFTLSGTPLSWSADVGLAVTRNGTTGASASLAISAGNTGAAFVYFGNSTTQQNGALYYDNSTNAMVFQTNGGSEKMRLDASGNLGIGVTPSAWGGGFKASQVGTASLSQVANRGYLTANGFYDGTNWKYIATDFATQYLQQNGTHIFYNAASGTAGNNITWTQAMTLDASGNLSLGTTTPAYLGNPTDIAQISVNRVPSSGTIINTGRSAAFINLNGASGGSIIQFATASANNTSPNEVARITSGGYFKASNNGSYFASTGSQHECTQSDTNAQALVVYASSASYTGAALDVQVNRNTTNDTFYAIRYFNTAAGAARFIVSDSGNVTNTNGTYGTISDERLKQDIVDAGSQWDDLKAVRFRKYRMKTDVEANPDAPFMLGVVAQELEQTSPGLVDEHPDFEEQEVTDEDGNVTTERVQVGTTKSVKSSILLMKAAVALQEAMARIEALEARLEALEA